MKNLKDSLNANHCFIIAEVGLNHNGSFELAMESVREAARAGADAVKFQNFITEDFLVDKSQTYTYKSQGEEITESFYELCKRNEFKREWIGPLFELCSDLGIEFISTPTSEEGVDDLVRAGCKTVKNGSDYITHTPLLKYMAESGMTVIISTGMSNLLEIDEAVDAVKHAAGGVVILQCTSNYPTTPEDVNLKRMVSLQERYKFPIGFSDHTIGHEAAIQALTLGAKVIEKHFTLSHDLPGPDHWFSVNPQELCELVKGIRRATLRLGSPSLTFSKSEKNIKDLNRIGVLSNKSLQAGQVLSPDDICFKKPLLGIKPIGINEFFGLRINKDIDLYQPITEDLFD